MFREFLREFIQMYHNSPCLWQVSSKHYHDRNKKEAAYAKLLEKLKEVDANATKDDVIKKINNIRSAVRKEKKKIKESLRSGASADSVYKPKLWYFSLLSFLSDQDIPRTLRSNLDSDDSGEGGEKTSQSYVSNTQEMVEEGDSTHYFQSVPSTSTSTPQREPRKRGDKEDGMEEMAKEVLVQVRDYFKKPRTEEDRFDVIGKGFAMKLRCLPREQMLLAERLMNDTLFQAEMGLLTMSHRVVGEPNPGSPASSHTSLATTEDQKPHVPQQVLGPNQVFHPNVPQGNETASSYLSSFGGSV